MSHKSIRFRLTIWYSLAVAAGLALFGSAIWFSMSHTLTADLDKMLADRARDLGVFIDGEVAERNEHLSEEINEYCHGFTLEAYVRVVDQKGSTIFASNGKFPWPIGRDAAGKFRELGWHGHAYRLFTVTAPVQGQQWQVTMAASLDTIQRLLERLRLLLLTFIPGVVLAAVLGGAWLSRRALKPVDDMVITARSIGIGNLSERLIVPNTGDELQRLSETWNSMLSRLEEAVKKLSRFAADASHELRTPLAVIRATAEIGARKSRSAEGYRQALEQIAVESERMTLLLDDLLFLARCDAESVEMPMAPLEFRALMREVQREIEPLAESRGIRLTAELPDEPCWVSGNDLALRRLVLVLLDNAIKYSSGGGDVRVLLGQRASDVLFEVRDQGPGIAAADIPQIFERFYRSRQARDAGQRGYGLGLSLAAGIARRHHASIQVESVPGKGSTFRLLIPRKEPAWARQSA